MPKKEARKGSSVLKKLLHNERLMELFRFAVTGGLSFLVDYGIMTVCKLFTPAPDWLSIALGFTVSVIVNYVLCAVWVFHGAKKQDLKSAVIFIGSSVIGLGLTELLMWLFMKIIDIFIAKIIVTLIVMVWNYFTKRIAVNGIHNKKDK